MQTSENTFDDVCQFIIKFGEQMHGYGPNAYRLEWYLTRITKSFGFDGVFSSTPTEIHFAFSEDKNSWQKSHISSMDGTGIELNRLAEVGKLIDQLEDGTVSLTEAYRRLDEIDTIAHPWGNVANAISYVSAGAAFPVLLGGGWWDVVLSGIFSLVVFFIVQLSGKYGPWAAVWLPFSTAFAAGVLTAIARYFLPEINGVLIILSAVLILVPGYGISVGVLEIVTKHINSGLSNLVSGLIYLFKQFFGAWFGVKLVSLLIAFPVAEKVVFIDSKWLWLFMPLLLFSLVIAFQTPKRDAFWAFAGMVVSYGAILLGTHYDGANFGNLLGMIAAVIFANVWSLKTGRPPSIILLPSFVLLVSGSIGFRGLAAISMGDVMHGGNDFTQMFIVALTLAAGLLIGNTLYGLKK